MPNRLLLTATLALLAVASGGCAYLSQFFKAAFQEPTFRFLRADVTDFSLGGLTLATRWELANPNGVGLSLASMDYALAIEDRPVLSGRPPQGLTIPARGTAELVFPATVRFQDIAPVVETFLTRDQAKYRASGSIGVQTPIGVVSFPLQYDGAFEVPKLPAVRMLNPKVSALTLTGATIEFPLEVTNRNTYPLPVSQVTGGVAIAGASVGSLSTGDLGALQGRGVRTVTLPLQLNFLQAGMAVANIVRGGTATVQFNAQVQSGGQQVPLPLSQALTFLR